MSEIKETPYQDYIKELAMQTFSNTAKWISKQGLIGMVMVGGLTTLFAWWFGHLKPELTYNTVIVGVSVAVTTIFVVTLISAFIAPFQLYKADQAKIAELKSQIYREPPPSTQAIEDEEPKPILELRPRELSVVMDDKGRIVREASNTDKNTAVALGIEFRFKPIKNIKRAVGITATIQINESSYKDGYWLKPVNNRAKLSAGDSDVLILAVTNGKKLFAYELNPIKHRREIIYLGESVPLPNDAKFKIDYICSQKGAVVETKTAKLHLSVNEGISVMEDSPIQLLKS